MGKKREKLSGPRLRGPSMASNPLRPTLSFLTRVVTGSFLRSQSKPSVGLRWQGKQAIFHNESGSKKTAVLP